MIWGRLLRRRRTAQVPVFDLPPELPEHRHRRQLDKEEIERRLLALQYRTRAIEGGR